MSRRLLRLLLALLALAVWMPPAEGGTRTQGRGYSFALPAELQVAPASLQESAAGAARTLLEALPLEPIGEPSVRMYATATGEQIPDAMLLVCTFDLDPAIQHPFVDGAGEEAFQAAYAHVARSLCDAKLRSCGRAEINASHRGLAATLDYLHPLAGDRQVFFALAIGDGTCLMLSMDASAAHAGRNQTRWDELAASLRLRRPDAAPGGWLRYGAIGVGGMVLLGLGFALFGWLRSGRRPSRSGGAFHAVASPSSALPGSAPAIRPADGLPVYERSVPDDEDLEPCEQETEADEAGSAPEPTPPPEEDAPDFAVPDHTFDPVRDTIGAAGVPVRELIDQAADAAAAQPPDREPALPQRSPAPAAPPPPGLKVPGSAAAPTQVPRPRADAAPAEAQRPPMIRRNRDYLSD